MCYIRYIILFNIKFIYYIYIYLDPIKKGSYSYGEYHFEYELFYVGKGINDRYLSYLKISKGIRKCKIKKNISKIKRILNDSYEPIIIKLLENLTFDDCSYYEKKIISIIGKESCGYITQHN